MSDWRRCLILLHNVWDSCFAPHPALRAISRSIVRDLLRGFWWRGVASASLMGVWILQFCATGSPKNATDAMHAVVHEATRFHDARMMALERRADQEIADILKAHPFE